MFIFSSKTKRKENEAILSLEGKCYFNICRISWILTWKINWQTNKTTNAAAIEYIILARNRWERKNAAKANTKNENQIIMKLSCKMYSNPELKESILVTWASEMHSTKKKHWKMEDIDSSYFIEVIISDFST